MLENHEVERIFNHKTCARFEMTKQRCRNKKANNYPKYGGRGIQVLMTLQEYRNFFKREIERLGYGFNRDDIQEVFERFQVDRIDRNGHYELGNVRLIEKPINQAKDSRCFHIRLTDELWTPCWCIDYVLDRSAESTKDAVKRGSVLAVSQMFNRDKRLLLLWLRVDEPPIKLREGNIMGCLKCGSDVRINRTYNQNSKVYECHQCGDILRNKIDRTNQMLYKAQDSDDIEKSLKYLYPLLRVGV